MSTSSLYTSVANVIVSANNLTTLYNATGGQVVTANVPDSDFTTLYTHQTDVRPTYPYGNSNVEAFLNAGFDSGGNTVQNINADGNIHANGSLTINSTTNLGNVGNVHITGGTLNYILQTDGTGNLSWVAQQGASGDFTIYTHFDVASTANNQQFTNSNLSIYANSYVMSVFKNGVNIEPTLYEKISDSVLQINILLNAGDTIDVLPSAAGAGSGPGGNLTEIQYNGGVSLSGNASFTFDQPNSLMTVGQISTGNITGTNTSISTLTVSGVTNLGDISNLHITGGSSGQFVTTNGSGNLVWSSVPITSINANIANVHISGGTNGQVLSTDGSNNLSWTSYIANSNFANTAALATLATTATTATTATSATSATTAGSATVAVNVTASSQPNITSVGTQTGFTSNGTVNFTNASNVALGSNSNVHITGGTASQVLSTDGTGNLSWLTVAIGTPNYSNFAGQVVDSAQPNITSTGTLTDLTVGGNLILQRAYEKFTTVGTGATGTINFNVLDQSILYYSANATANFTLNFRGNGTTTFNSSVPTNDTVTLVMLNTVGATAYIANTIQIDGSNITPKYVNGLTPSTGTRLANAKQSYTYTIMKTGSGAYTVLGSLTEYQ